MYLSTVIEDFTHSRYIHNFLTVCVCARVCGRQREAVDFVCINRYIIMRKYACTQMCPQHYQEIPIKSFLPARRALPIVRIEYT